MSKITITVKDGEIDRVMVLNQPNFEQLAIAYNAYLSGFAKGQSGMPNMPKAGKVLIDTCVDEKATDKMFFDANSATLMFSAALKAAEIIEIFEAELKKN